MQDFDIDNYYVVKHKNKSKSCDVFFKLKNYENFKFIVKIY